MVILLDYYCHLLSIELFQLLQNELSYDFVISLLNSNNKAVDKVKVVSFNFHTVLDLIINKFYLITTALHHNNLPNRSKICSKNTDQSN